MAKRSTVESSRKGAAAAVTIDLPAAPADAQQGFEADAPAVMRRLASAMRALVDAVPGGVGSAAELERGLGVTKKVAWQVHKIAEAREALAAAAYVPGADPVRKLLAAAEKRRVPARVRAEVAGAFEAFESFVRAHAGDRASFLSMIAPPDSEADADVDRLHRRACFRAYSHFMGAQIRTRYGVMIVRRDDAARQTDTFVSLRARMGLRRLRSDSAVVVDRYFVTTGFDGHGGGTPGVPSAATDAPMPQPLDPAALARHGAPVLPAFSTKPLPKLRTIDEGAGVARVELAESTVGRSGAVDLVFGNVTPGVPGAPGADGRPHGFHTMLKNDLPTELLVADVLVHAGDYGRLEPELYVYGDPNAEESAERRDRSPLFKVRDRVQYLGRGLGVGACEELPRYTEMLAHLCGGLQWDAGEFDVYRLRIEFPLMHTVVRIAFPLPGGR